MVVLTTNAFFYQQLFAVCILISLYVCRKLGWFVAIFFISVFPHTLSHCSSLIRPQCCTKPYEECVIAVMSFDMQRLHCVVYVSVLATRITIRKRQNFVCKSNFLALFCAHCVSLRGRHQRTNKKKFHAKMINMILFSTLCFFLYL